MATHEPRSWAQDIISCNFCKNPTKQFCNSCQVNLCVECLPKHVDDKQSMSHDIVHYKNRKAQLVFTECEFHEGQRCQVQCQQCQTPICIVCCIGPHKNHEAVQIDELVEIKKLEIQKDTEEIEGKIISYCSKTDADLPDNLREITEEITKAEQEMEVLRKLWHQEVDDIFYKLASFFAFTKDRNSETLKTHQIKMKTCIQSMNQTLQRNKKILKSNNASDFTDYKSELDNYRGIDTDIDFTKLILKAKTLKGEKMSMEVGNTKAKLTFTSVPSLLTNASDRTDKTHLYLTQMRPAIIPATRRIRDREDAKKYRLPTRPIAIGHLSDSGDLK